MHLTVLMIQQVLIGIDTMEMINEMELFGPSEIDFGFEELDDGASDDGDDDDDGDGEDEDEDHDEDDDDDDADDEYNRVSLYKRKSILLDFTILVCY